MSKLKVIAVELPFLISYEPAEPVSACVLLGNDLYLYTRQGEMLRAAPAGDYIGTVEYGVREGRYEWTDFVCHAGQIITRDYDYQIVVNGEGVDPFPKSPDINNGSFSNTSLRFFNDFLKKANSTNSQMVEALEISLRDGFFRKEVEEIVENDEIRELSQLDKEIIVRCKIQGEAYISSYVREQLDSDKPDRFITINYFFRRLFNLERENYLSFQVN